MGCSFDFFKKHIESQFDENMNWENQGSYWWIDHIVPLSYGKTEKDIIKLNNYKNLRPLEKKENIIKCDSLPENLQEKLKDLNWHND